MTMRAADTISLGYCRRGRSNGAKDGASAGVEVSQLSNSRRENGRDLRMY